jgi:hypothetical protein
MPVQMWFIAQKGEVTEETTRELTRAVREQGGLILMMTKTGPLVALEDQAAPVVEQHPLVGRMGPVSLNPRGIAVDRLQRIFAENLSKQLDLTAFDQSEAALE